MITIPGYTIMGVAYSGAFSTVYRGYNRQDSSPVVIKVMNSEIPSDLDMARIRRGYEIAKELDFQGVLHPVDLVPFQQSYALVLEDSGGTALSTILADHRPDLVSGINIAVKIAETLGKIHQRGVVHKNIRSSCIIVNEKTGRVDITDFSIASRVFGERQEHVDLKLLEGTPAYISPEQTGRIDRGIDYHSDLYSLGVVLYEIFSGVRPFTSPDAGELIYCHLAVTPKPPVDIEAGIPAPLSDIIMKLLAKNAEERYRSAFGLKNDLNRCLDQVSSGEVEQFVLGENDVPIVLHIPEKVYGRDKETAEILDAFSDAAEGRPGIIMVKGPPGIGKSALINELHKPVISRKGYFAAGKFDQFKRDVPYSALRQAFARTARHLLGEQAERVSEWKRRLHYVLGPNGRIIVDLIPEMELIIGRQPQVEVLPPTESMNRFNMVLTEFIKVFARPEHPLVLFLDDIQWADRGTLKLIELLATAPDMGALLLIGAYRDTEVDSAHPLALMLEDVGNTGFEVNEILLDPLPEEGVVGLIGDTLACGRSDAEELAAVVIKKTLGNPFFINQFLTDLYQRGMLYLDTDKYTWRWDIGAIQKADITTNVVEFLCGKIKQLSGSAQNALTIASCIGSRFDLGMLARVSGKTLADISEVLGESRREGLIAPIGVSYGYPWTYADETRSVETGVTYMFLHDRIQQAAYSLMPEDRKKEVHYQAGMIILEQTPPDKREERLFDIAEHLNLSADKVSSVKEKVRLAGLNLDACRKAKSASAYETALRFAEKGLELLGTHRWKSNYWLTRDLALEKAECAYLVGDLDGAETALESVLDNVRTNEEKARVYDLKTIIYALLGDLVRSVKAGLAGLQLLDMKVPERPGKLRVFLEFANAFLRLHGRKPEALLNLPEMTDKKQKMIIRLIMNTISCAYLSNQNLFAFLCLRGFYLTLRYGVTESSPFMMHTYAFALADNFDAYKSAYDFGKVSFYLNERFPSAYMRSKITCLFSFFFSHWRRPIQEGLSLIKNAFSYTVEVGDHVFAGYSSCTLFLYLMSRGRNIDDILAETKSYEDFIRRADDQFSIDFHTLKNQLIKNLKGQTSGALSMSDDTYDEDTAVQGFKNQKNANLLFHYHAWKGLIFFLNYSFKEADSMFRAAERYAHGVALLPSVGDHIFYYSLNLAALYPGSSLRGRRKIRRVLNRNLRKLKKWARNNPESFSHKFSLVLAEKARIHNRQGRAMDLYTGAVSAAGEQGFTQVEALANELLARFHLSFNRERACEVYMREASKCYRKWGAAAKVRMLNEKYGLRYGTGHLLQEPRIDIASVLKATQAISEEIVLGDLLKEVMKIAIQNAGAQKGFLILQREDGLFIEAEGRHGVEDINVLQSVPVGSSGDLSSGIVNYVKRTGETVVLHNALEEGLFISDPYVTRNRSKSILCIPIIKQRELTGVLYLENDLLTDAFTEDRTEVLSILASQAAISLENAKLYEDVGQRVAQLQRAEAKIKESLQEKEVLLREIHHRVKNNMQIISSLLRLQVLQTGDDGDIETLKESQNRIKSMSLVHEKLYESRDLARINFRDYVRDLTQLIFRSYGAEAGKAELKIEAEDIWLGIDTVIPCGLIITELVSNSLKHAFPLQTAGGQAPEAGKPPETAGGQAPEADKKGLISISVHRAGEDRIELVVSDNGTGLPEGQDFRNTETLGLRLVTTLSEDQLGGRIEIRRTGGTEFRLNFKEIKYQDRV